MTEYVWNDDFPINWEQDAFWIIDSSLVGYFDPLPLKSIVQNFGESNKTLGVVEKLAIAFLEMGMKRKDRLFVAGGGTATDVGGLVAALLYRGVRVEFVPTTLLAMVDSAVGGKNGVNINGYKNQLGTVYMPARTWLYPRFLSTLSSIQWACGFAECLKMAFLEGAQAFDLCQKRIAKKDLRPLIEAAIAFKEGLVALDPFDTEGIRWQLNFGHTFAHAIESASQWCIPHGIAVAMGCVAALHFSSLRALLPIQCADTWAQPFRALYQGIQRPSCELILNAMRHDKKHEGEGIRMVFTRGAGQIESLVVDVKVLEEELQQAIENI